MAKRPLVLTAGEPAGIGPELCLAMAGTPLAERLVVVADPEVLRKRGERIGVDIQLIEVDPSESLDDALPPASLRVCPTPMPNPDVCGVPAIENAAALLDGLRIAVAGCVDGRFAGMVTAPLQKSAINDAGIPFSGHTEFIAELTETPQTGNAARRRQAARGAGNDAPAACRSNGSNYPRKSGSSHRSTARRFTQAVFDRRSCDRRLRIESTRRRRWPSGTRG